MTGIRWAGREQGVDRRPSTVLHPQRAYHLLLSTLVHNNFDSRVIIAFFGVKQVFPKNILSRDDDCLVSNRSRLDNRIFSLFLDCDPEIRLFVSLFPFFAPIFSISFNCEIIFFPLATLSPLSDSFPFPLHHNFLSFVLLRSKLSTTPAKSGQRILPHIYSFEPRLFTFHPFISHTRSKKEEEIVQNKSSTPCIYREKTLAYQRES